MPNYNSDKRPTITVAKARRILGMIAKNYSDTQIKDIRDLLLGAAELVYDEMSEDTPSSTNGN